MSGGRLLAIAPLLLLLVVACRPAAESSPSPRPTAGVTPAPGAAVWQRLAAAPLALTEVAGAAFDGELWVAGGLDGSGVPTNRVFAYDPATDRWREGPALPNPIHHSALVATPDGLVLLGGYPAALEGSSDGVWRLAPGAQAWTAGVVLAEPRAAGAAAWDGSRIVYGGGIGPNGVSNAVWALEDGAWAVVGTLSRAREHFAATSAGDGRAWFLGGRAGGLEGNMATVDVVEGTAARPVGEVPTARGGVAAFWHPSAGACLVGGESPGGTNPQVECISLEGTLTQLPNLGAARHGLAAVVIDGVAYVGQGGEQPGLFVSGILEALRLTP